MTTPNVREEDKSEIVFLDVETTFPTRPGQGRALLEFGAILVCPWKLLELESYATLIRPEDLSMIDSLSVRRSGISRDGVLSAPSFREVADCVYDILHGRVWAGHNILKFDCVRIKEAFDEIGRLAPEPKGTIDSLAIFTQKFGSRAGNMKMATLAAYFGLGEQTHRSLDDVRMNLEVFKSCATVMFLESSLPDIFPANSAGFLDPNEVSISSIWVAPVPCHWGSQSLRILHKDSLLQLCCSGLRVRYGISTKFSDHAGRPKINFVVDISPNLCRVLDACDDAALKVSVYSGSDSEWWPAVMRKNDYFVNTPNVRLHLYTSVSEENTMSGTEIYHQDSSGTAQKLTFDASDAGEHDLGLLLVPGSAVDAYISLELYDYKQSAGIKLAVKKLVIHSA